MSWLVGDMPRDRHFSSSSWWGCIVLFPVMASLTSKRWDVNGLPSFLYIMSWIKPLAGPWLFSDRILSAACCWLNAHSCCLLRGVVKISVQKSKRKLGFRFFLGFLLCSNGIFVYMYCTWRSSLYRSLVEVVDDEEGYYMIHECFLFGRDCLHFPFWKVGELMFYGKTSPEFDLLFSYAFP